MTALLAWVALLMGAGSARGEPPRDLATAVAELVEASRNATVVSRDTLFDGREVLSRTLPEPTTTHRWQPPPDWPAPRAPLPGRAVLRRAETPRALLPVPGQGILIGDATSLTVLREDGTTTTVLPLPVGALLPNRDGTKILVAAEAGEGPLILDAATLQPMGGPIDWIRGARLYWGEKPNSVLAVYELIDFSAASRTRIFLRASEFDLTTREEAPYAGTSRLAALGHIAPAGLTWAHERIDYQVDPVPAPLLAMRDGEARRAYDASPYADVQPSGDGAGTLLWLRTARRGSAATRLWGRRGGGAPLPLTDHPTYAVGIAADGSLVALAARPDPDEMAVIHVATVDELFAADPRRGEADRLLYRAFEAAKAAIILDFARSPLGEDVEDTPFGPVLRRAPTAAEVEAAGAVARRAFEESFKLEFPEGLGALAVLDALMDQHAGLAPEHPALILGIGGMVARAAREEGLGPYLLQSATRALTTDFEEAWWSDGLTYSLLSPFAAARERIGADEPLVPMLTRVLAHADRPVFFVENFGEETQQAAQMVILMSAGVDPRNFGFPDVFSAMQANPEADAVAVLAYRLAMEEGQWSAAVLAARRLARNNPDHPETFLMLAEALAPLGLVEEALVASRWATELTPADAAVWMRHGHLLFDESRFDEARAAYRTALEAPNGSLYREEIEDRLRLAAELEAAP